VNSKTDEAMTAQEFITKYEQLPPPEKEELEDKLAELLARANARKPFNFKEYKQRLLNLKTSWTNQEIDEWEHSLKAGWSQWKLEEF